MKNSAKRERFLAVTLRLIHKKGFRATTMRDIAQELNFEVANVYNYIPSKNALLEGYIFGIQDEFHRALDPILSSSYDPKEKLKLIISSYVRITVRRPYEQAVLVNEWRNLKESRLQEFLQRRKQYEDKVVGVLREGVVLGLFAEVDVEFATQTILASLRWLYTKCLKLDARNNPVEMEKQLIDFIFKGISKDV